MQNKITSMLGLATKAGKLVSGEFMVENAVKDHSAKLVILATDCSDNTKKKFRNQTTYRHVPYYEYSDKEELGRCIGKEFRACVAVTDEGFATSIRGLLEQL
ncbi:Ribosomal protein L7Ae [Lachnospiraceae bacterium XBB1006]|nr:Ribosomal protein L7Ae [Lachnospiraceae bacterium XBB1006]